VVCVLSCKVLIFFPTASGILLCSVCSQFGEASVTRFCFFVPDSNNIHAPGAVGKTHCHLLSFTAKSLLCLIFR
jgi:hypothetical protein